MMWNLLADVVDPYRQATFGEAALYAGLGFLIVFVGIAFLIFIVWAVGKLIPFIEGKASKPKAKPAAQESAATPMQTAAGEDELSDEVLAVITAAIAAYYQQENKKCEFTVKRIKRL